MPEMPESMHGPFCACLTVKMLPRHYPDGSQSDRWVCISCGNEFVSRLAAEARLAEVERERDEVRDVLGRIQSEGGVTSTVYPELYRLRDEAVQLRADLRALEEERDEAVALLRRHCLTTESGLWITEPDDVPDNQYQANHILSRAEEDEWDALHAETRDFLARLDREGK